MFSRSTMIEFLLNAIFELTISCEDKSIEALGRGLIINDLTTSSKNEDKRRALL